MTCICIWVSATLKRVTINIFSIHSHCRFWIYDFDQRLREVWALVLRTCSLRVFLHLLLLLLIHFRSKEQTPECEVMVATKCKPSKFIHIHMLNRHRVEALVLWRVLEFSICVLVISAEEKLQKEEKSSAANVTLIVLLMAFSVLSFDAT